MENKLSTRVAFFTLLSIFAVQAQAAGNFSEVWTTTQEGRYSSLPEHKTTNASFFAGSVNLLANSANRTLKDKSDILPYFQKLVHPIGICFSGTWDITEDNNYTGYFAKNASGLIIVRASEAMGNGKRGDWRAFGLAGKIFPTTNAKDAGSYETANFFTVDDLGGTGADSFLELEKTNEPKTSFHLGSVFLLPMIHTIVNTFTAADANPGFRQLYQIAELGVKDPSTARAPHWMMLQSETPSLGKAAPADFRDELRLKNYSNHGLKFAILTSDKGDKAWKRLGAITLTEEALSSGCDHRLHFQHPKLRK